MVWGWGVFFFFMGVSVDKLNTYLLGEGQFDLLAGWSSKTIGTFVNSDGGSFNFWDLDALFFNDIFAGYSWEGDWFVDTGLFWFWDNDGYWWFYNWDRWYVVLGFLGNFVTVLVTVSSVSTMSVTTISRLADGDHLGLGFLGESNFDGLASGLFALWFVTVGANFIGDDFDGFGTDSSGDSVTLFNRFDELDVQCNIGARLGNGWCAYISWFNNIYDGAVVFWLFVSVCWSMVSVSWGWVSVSWGWVSISWSWVSISWSWVSISWSCVWVAWSSSSEEGKSQKCEDLHFVFVCLS